MSEAPIVDALRLRELLPDTDVRVVDVRPSQLYVRGHIPGAVNLPVFLLGSGGAPTAELVARSLGKLGVSAEHHLVAYDDGGTPAAPRLFWVLSYYRHARVSVLDGGIRSWIAHGYPLDAGTPPASGVCYRVGEPDTSLLVTTDGLLESLGQPGQVVLDARSSAEYQGFHSAAMRNGHIPGAVNVEWTESLVEGKYGTELRPRSELERLFLDAGVGPDQHIVVHCQSGNRASYSFLALKHLGYPHVSHYADGWQEWGNRIDMPVESE